MRNMGARTEHWGGKRRISFLYLSIIFREQANGGIDCPCKATGRAENFLDIALYRSSEDPVS